MTATASTANLDFVRRLGADEVIDYRAQRFEDVVGGVDVVFDTVGGETLDRSWGVLKPGGRLVTAADPGETTDERSRAAYFIVEPNRRQLAEIARLIEEVRSARSLAPCSRSPRRGRRISTSLTTARLYYVWLTVEVRRSPALGGKNQEFHNDKNDVDARRRGSHRRCSCRLQPDRADQGKDDHPRSSVRTKALGMISA